VNLVSRIQRQTVNHTLGIGLAVFIAAYFVATIFFIIFE
jgi:hypothetical protein